MLLLRDCGAGFWRWLLLLLLFSSLFISQKMLGGVTDVHIGARAHTRVDGASECERGGGERKRKPFISLGGGGGGGGEEKRETHAYAPAATNEPVCIYYFIYQFTVGVRTAR